LQTRNWEAQDGSRRSKTEIVAENLINLSPRRDGTTTPKAETGEEDQTRTEEKAVEKVKTAKSETEEIDINDIPF